MGQKKAEAPASANGGAAANTPGEVVYLVQARKSAAGVVDWTDVDVVMVPPRTKRATVREKAREVLAAGDFTLEAGERAMVRVIRIEDAEPFVVEMEQPPPQLKLK